MRGFWTGILSGFYRDSHRNLTSRCLNDVLITDITFILKVLIDKNSRSITNLLKSMVRLARTMNNNMFYCGVSEAVEDIQYYCTFFAC